MIAAGTAVRMAVAAGALWRDEVNLVNVAQMPGVARMLDALAHDSAPVLYVALVRAWTWPAWSGEDHALRMLGLLVTLVTLAGAGWAARRLDAGVPLLALGLVVAHGYVLDVQSAVRPHGAGVLLAMLALAATWRLLAAPGWRAFALTAAVFTVSVQTLFALGTMIAALCVAGGLVALAGRRWRAAGLGVAAGGVAALSLVPYAGTLRRVMDASVLDARPVGAVEVILRMAEAFAGGDPFFMAVWLVVAVAALAGAVAVLRAPAERARVAYAWLAVVVAPVAYGALLVDRRQPISYWHFPWVMALVALALDTVFARRRWLRWARVALVLLALPLIVPLADRLAGMRRTNVDLIAAHLAANARREDLIVVNPWSIRITLGRYYRGDVPVVTLPPIDAPRVYRHDLVRERMASAAPLAPLHEAIERTLGAGHRVWLVGDLSVPEPDKPPVVLPPAPGTSTGWAYPPYAQSWMQQTGDLLLRQALQFRPIDLGDSHRTHDVEFLRFGVVEGWRKS